jgi:hydroxymethylglutaryl-CoA reductase
MAVATVGGTLRAHPGARLSLKIIGARTGTELGMVIGAVGLASNLAALRALAAEGIQHGHMALHARSVAVAAGASGSLVDEVAAELSRGGQITIEHATSILNRLRAQ